MLHRDDTKNASEEVSSICRGNVIETLRNLDNDQQLIRSKLSLALLRHPCTPRLSVNILNLSRHEAETIETGMALNMGDAYDEDELQYWLTLASNWSRITIYLEHLQS